MSSPTNVWRTIASGQWNATTASSMASRTCWPAPVRSRASSAAVIACAAVTAVSLSGTITRSMRGRPPPPPWIDASPESAWITGSYTRLCAYGPLSPKPLIDT